MNLFKIPHVNRPLFLSIPQEFLDYFDIFIKKERNKIKFFVNDEGIDYAN